MGLDPFALVRVPDHESIDASVMESIEQQRSGWRERALEVARLRA